MSVNESGAPFYHCFDSRPALLVLTAYFITKLLLLFPLYIFILYLGHQRWRQHRSLNTTSHSDIFNYNMAAVDLSSLVAYVFFFYCIDTNLPMMIEGGFYVANMVFPGEMCFHVLTCVERYLAIVHPITYRGLRLSGGASMDINMPINSSSFVNRSSSNVSLHLVMNACYRSKIFVFSVSITNLLLLPLFILILYLGYQQRRQQHNISTAATMSHSDFFMYHSIVMHLNTVLGVTFFICGSYINLQEMMSVGLSVWSVTSLGQAVVHLLTCVERYLAVVHPITYRGLRQTGGHCSSLYPQAARAGGSGWEQGARGPIKAEGFPHHHGYNGSAFV
ncbi:uncharacterized protein AKAME5_002077100 [Lates japonicus]|uniref:G-protein coupled receptors family 1 profile domain-containing protein n=1 Tax=Lates japonicus TaxID=270547 RepID=A0AAD3NCR7_LATJO|nr:uncharacterized protein AKAME5_002077100 [Lates japonicus]